MSSDRNHSVIITGASRGIGRRIAQAFARQTDYALLLVARTESDLQDTQTLCSNIGDNEIAIQPLDASNSKATKKISLPDGFPTPKIIINNAGSYLLKTLAKTSYEEFNQEIQNNLFSAVNITNRFLDDLKQKSHALIIKGLVKQTPQRGSSRR